MFSAYRTRRFTSFLADSMQACPAYVVSISLLTLFLSPLLLFKHYRSPNLLSISINFYSNCQEKPGHVTIFKAESIRFRCEVAARINAWAEKTPSFTKSTSSFFVDMTTLWYPLAAAETRLAIDVSWIIAMNGARCVEEKFPLFNKMSVQLANSTVVIVGVKFNENPR